MRREWLVPPRSRNRSHSQQAIRDEQWSSVVARSKRLSCNRTSKCGLQTRTFDHHPCRCRHWSHVRTSPASFHSFLSQLARRPVISFAQHRFWKEPFSRTEASLREYRITVHGKPIDIPPELEWPITPGGEPFAPFNIIGMPLRASTAFNSGKPARKKPPLYPPAVALPMRSRFSHQ
jgi:hypothetical protein